MIKQNELRIGNYVQWSDEPGVYVPWMHGHWLGTFNENYPFPEPIPLTSEWLLKFGFTKVNTHSFENIKLKYYCKDAVCLFFNGSPPENTYLTGHGFNLGMEYYASTAKWIDSVHELMNYYYAITGKELIIQEKQIEPPMMGMSY